VLEWQASFMLFLNNNPLNHPFLSGNYYLTAFLDNFSLCPAKFFDPVSFQRIGLKRIANAYGQPIADIFR
jgi:hypothetical protein